MHRAKLPPESQEDLAAHWAFDVTKTMGEYEMDLSFKGNNLQVGAVHQASSGLSVAAGDQLEANTTLVYVFNDGDVMAFTGDSFKYAATNDLGERSEAEVPTRALVGEEDMPFADGFCGEEPNACINHELASDQDVSFRGSRQSDA
eukprot:scaffold614264_cov52-Prasinocladus_malaysianus.AAC.1